jgi:hypothetical protein
MRTEIMSEIPEDELRDVDTGTPEPTDDPDPVGNIGDIEAERVEVRSSEPRIDFSVTSEIVSQLQGPLIDALGISDTEFSDIVHKLQAELGVDFLDSPHVRAVLDKVEPRMELWIHQILSFNCGVAVQKMILSAYGIEVSEAELVLISLDNRTLDADGMNPDDVGAILESYGIPVETIKYVSEERLRELLESGCLVIAGVDADELWAWRDGKYGEYRKASSMTDPDHVVWIIGIDDTDPDNPMVIVNDSGRRDGAGTKYPMDVFLRSWDDLDRFCVYTKEPPQAPEMNVDSRHGRASDA